MLDILEYYLVNTATPELVTTLKEAHAIFDKINLTGYEAKFEELLLLSGDVDQSQTLNKIIEVTKELQEQVLLDHAIILIDDITVEMNNVFISGIFDIQDYENKDEITNVVSTGVNSEETLAELLSLVSSLSVEELLSNIDSVNQSLIVRIKETSIPSPLEDNEDELILKQIHITKFIRFCNYVHTHKLNVSKMLSNGISVGFPFLVYADIIGRDLESMNEKQAAVELIGMALVSNDGVNNVRGIIKEHIEKYVASLDAITRINIIISDLLLGLEK